MPNCKICGEYDWTGNHRCPPKWYCAYAGNFNNPVEEADDIRKDSYTVYAQTAEKAAIEFAELYQGNHMWYPEEMETLVMNEQESKIWEYVVSMESVPSYSIWYNRKPKIYDLTKEE